MSNEEMFSAIMVRMDTMQGSLDSLNSRMDSVEGSLDSLNSRMDSVESSLDSLNSRMDSVESSLNSRMDSVEGSLNGLSGRIDSVESKLSKKIDNLESNVFMEIQAVRTEMEVVNRSLKRDISVLDQKIDRLMFSKDVDGYERMKVRVEVLEEGYQKLKEKIC